ncbi:MAG TPA: DNA methyltransferase [Candidatus Paceibacterota bacterium]|nr:DNA methyltransferase [Candidatus Paceibacterota bacterium]
MINWRDIQDRAEEFAYTYRDAADEDKEAKPFWTDLFHIFGITARSIGMFEERVKQLNDRDGYIDYFAPGRFLIEHKTRGKDLDRAFAQAARYFESLAEEDKPRYVIICDFGTFRIYDLEATERDRLTTFTLEELPKRVKELAFFTDEEVREYKPEEHIDVKAVRAVGRLHQALASDNYPKEYLPTLLTRLVFCFFADDTSIFEHNLLRRYLDEHAAKDGSDIGAHLTQIFEILNTREDRRQASAPETLLKLPYVNGGLFAEPIHSVFGTRAIRDTLISCFAFDWSDVSPAVFGSMFQSVLDSEDNGRKRHDLGAHYTSETNIRKVADGLFLDELRAALEKAKTQEALMALWDRVAGITLLDPACGCGNFLVVSYRELRRIEIEIIKKLDKGKRGFVAAIERGQGSMLHLEGAGALENLSRMSVERMYGIEIDDFPAEVAKLSLWLVDHMMNMELGAYYGKPLRKLPLTQAPHIVHGNALELDWEDVVPKGQLSYILGNPPFLGKKEQKAGQKEDMEKVWGDTKGAGVLDFVSAWYKKAADLIAGTRITVAFVSTNSITQGEQVGILWPYLLARGIKIHFAHRTFRWSNEAAGKAAVHCVIIGFGDFDIAKKALFAYADIAGMPERKEVANINPYLVAAPDVVVTGRTKPINGAPRMNYGSMPIDSGALILSPEDADSIRNECPQMAGFVRPYMGGEEFLNGTERFCLWLADAAPEHIRTCSPIRIRVESVRAFRESSGRLTTKKLAETPYRFGEIRQPASDYILVPKVSSENRPYMPVGIIPAETIASGSVLIIPGHDLFAFGIVSSQMHMAWMRAVCGRLESRYQYSAGIVYNNFPWPEHPSDEQKAKVEECARAVLDARAAHAGATLADLYDPLTMPADLLKAHHALDRAVDACYGSAARSFPSEPARLEFLFEKYKELINPKWQEN